MTQRIQIALVLVAGMIPAIAFATFEQYDPSLLDRTPQLLEKMQRPNDVDGDRALGFEAENVQLEAWLPLSSFGNPDNGNDCWGYTSASGREYALMGVRNAMFVVEITNPSNPSIIGSVGHSSSLWADIKVYQDVAYVCNENDGGIDVIDLSQVDNGTITLVQRMTTGGLSSSHNIAIDTDSGFLYLCGGNINGGRIVAYNLSNPHYPTLAGQMNGGPTLHDAQVVTYNSGPYAGRQVCFGAAGGSGMYAIDVTNKSNMYTISVTTYSGLSYCHQCWLSEDRNYLYVNDELDSIAETRVIDVSNLENPTVVNSFGWGANSIDHNLYVKGDRLYEANYTSGLRVFDLSSNPVNPTMIGYFDTYPNNNGQSYNGLWSCFPFFDSGTVLGSDIQGGLFIWKIGQPNPCDVPLGSCADDVDGDGIIGVTDVLIIISNWGVCGDGTFRPEGDVDDNCCVDVADLLQVIGLWGTECVPMGACCYGEGTCADLSETECAEFGGNYVGDDATCASTNCPGAGDECNVAMTAYLGANAFETDSATPSSPEPDDSMCDGTWMNWANSQDIWFAWVAEFSGNAHFTTCDSSSYDTSMAIYSGSCTNQSACNGDASGESGCQAYYSAIDMNVKEGETYYIRIGGWEGDTGIGTLTIE